MSPHLLLALLTAPALGHDLPVEVRPARAPVARTLDFAALTWPEAVRLQGRLVQIEVDLDAGTEDVEGDDSLYEAAGRRPTCGRCGPARGLRAGCRRWRAGSR
jgi:hypothetical protein